MSESMEYEIIIKSNPDRIAFEYADKELAAFEMVAEEGTNKAYIPLDVLLMIQRLHENDMKLKEIIYPKLDLA